MPLCSASVPCPLLHPAVLVVAVERHAAGAMHRGIFVDGAGLQARQRHNGLERGARRLLRLNGAVQQRMIGIVGDLAPVLGLDAPRELVRIEGGAADHGQHFPVRGSSATTAPFLPSMASSATACRSRSMVSCRSLPCTAFLVASACRTCPRLSTTTALPVHAHQRVVVLPLDAELAHHVALVVFGELRRIQFLLADFAGVPDDVRHHAVLRIEAAAATESAPFPGRSRGAN